MCFCLFPQASRSMKRNSPTRPLNAKLTREGIAKRASSCSIWRQIPTALSKPLASDSAMTSPTPVQETGAGFTAHIQMRQFATRRVANCMGKTRFCHFDVLGTEEQQERPRKIVAPIKYSRRCDAPNEQPLPTELAATSIQELDNLKDERLIASDESSIPPHIL